MSDESDRPIHEKSELSRLIRQIDFGTSIAEQDALLETARVETSAFGDLFHDRIDLVPGTKGSGKSALYKIFVEYLAALLLLERKVVVAYGVQSQGDVTFQAFQEHFEALSEDEFVNFWCIYLVALAREHFVNADEYAKHLESASKEVDVFKDACVRARIPEMGKRLSLRDVLGWALNAVKAIRPGVKVDPEDGSLLFSVFPEEASPSKTTNEYAEKLPQYVSEIKDRLQDVLAKANLKLWLMIDRLDEIFPRRSDVETRALRGLLRTLRIFESSDIRVKVFLRDDILSQITTGGKGFTALTHITARQADTLRWSQEQVLTLIVNRLFAPDAVADAFDVDKERLKASHAYREECFYRVFPQKVHRGENQSPTLRWIYNHCADGNGVVTPRDVIDLLTKARQHQLDELSGDAQGQQDYVIGPAAIQYGLEELSKRKRTTYLEAEFPHLWPSIKKFIGGKAEWTQSAVERLLGKRWEKTMDDLVSIGLFKESKRNGSRTYQVPFLYRAGLELTQGRAE